MQLETLVCFYEIAQGRTFLDVAESHNLSQSALSKSIRKLESELGFPLLDRSSRKVKLTPAGWQILQDLNGLPALYERLVSHAAQLNSSRRISVWLTMPGNILGIKSIIAGFQRDHPEILLSVGQTRRDPRMLSGTEPSYENECDFTVMHRPLRCPEGFVYDILYEDAVVALIPRAHPLAGKPTLQFADLKDQSVLVNFWGQYFLPEIMDYTGISLENLSVLAQSREDLAWRCIASRSIVLFYASDMYMCHPKDIVVRVLEDLPIQPIVLVRSENADTAQAQVLHQYILSAVRRSPIRLSDCCQLPS